MARKRTHSLQGSLFADPEPSLLATPTLETNPPTGLPGLPDSWAEVLAEEFHKPYLAKLLDFVQQERSAHEVLPAAEDVFNAYRFTSPDRVRVVILGQDPYPTPGHAHGLCFSVRPGVHVPASLRNIYQELHSDLGIAPVQHGYLEQWAKQGCLMLNAVLTVRAGQPASHANRGWEQFTDATLRYLSSRTTRIVFVLWGAYAQKKAKLIDTSRHTIIASAHPSPLSACAGFFGSKPFSKVNAALVEAGLEPINWQLPTTVA